MALLGSEAAEASLAEAMEDWTEGIVTRQIEERELWDDDSIDDALDLDKCKEEAEDIDEEVSHAEALFEEEFWWPSIEKSVELYVKPGAN